MKPLNVHEEVQKQVGMYFDQALDPTSKDEFLQKVHSDPTYYQAFQREQAIRDHLKKSIHRPDNSSQLVMLSKTRSKRDRCKHLLPLASLDKRPDLIRAYWRANAYFCPKHGKMKNVLWVIVFGLSGFGMVHAQVYTNKPLGEKNEALVDSLKTTPYPYVLPIWGDKATALGFDLPYSAGLSVNYLTQESELVINNIMVGFNNGPMYDIDEIIRIDEAIANASALNIRPDIWVFPFLNVYGILGKVSTSTKISAGIFLPDTSNVWSEVAGFGTTAEFDGTVMGFGITPTMGVGGGWIALDMNFAWSDIDALDKPVKTFVFGPRFGKTFKFKRPQNQIALWVGGFRVKFSSETTGSLPLIDLFPDADIQGKVDGAIMNVEEKQMNVDEWWSNLSAIEQANPINKAKYETANRVLNSAGELLNGIDGALNDEEMATVQYSLDKGLKDAWNFIVGTQYQLNKNWMIRAEVGFLGSREQLLASLQYRFGL